MSDDLGHEGSAGEHRADGLDLARSVAAGLAGSGVRPIRPKRGARDGSARGRPSRGRPAYSGAHPDERDPQTLDDALTGLVAEQGWDADVRVHGVFTRWAAIVGADVAEHCRPESFAAGADPTGGGGGKLVVRAESTAWATQLRLLAGTVVRRLNEELGDRTVSVVEVVGPAGPSWKKGRRSVRDGRGPRDTYG
jgi:predicted nucleic acid-binding Zn ribbon protein